MRHLLVTNDFPPKIGGIQSYLWELWRRLPPDTFTVLTTPYREDRRWDARQPFEVRRTKQRWLLPTHRLANQINAMVRTTQADFVVLDPILPLGLVGPRLDVPYVGIAHGAEYVIPARLPGSKSAIRRVTNGSSGMVAGGAYVERAVRSMVAKHAEIPVLSVPPGVDTKRFQPLSREQRDAVRARLGLAADAQLVVGVSRLVPRKGFDRLVDAAAILQSTHPRLQVLIAGKGRESKRLEQQIERTGAPVRLLGRVPDSELPALYGAADVFCMPCHDRWMGLEAEGFGIVFCEAAATGIPVVAGQSGGSTEAVDDGETGFVVSGRVSAPDVAEALARVLKDAGHATEMGWRGRQRTVEHFGYDHLARRLETFFRQLPFGADKSP